MNNVLIRFSICLTFIKSMIICIVHVLIFRMRLLFVFTYNILIAVDTLSQIEPPGLLEGRWTLEQE